MRIGSSATQGHGTEALARAPRTRRLALAAGVVALAALFALIRVDGASAARIRPLEMPGEAPTVETGAASAITTGSASIAGTVDPDGLEVTACEVEYGPTEAYGSSEPCESLPGAGTEAVPVTAPLAGLAADTTYHYRLAATNESGTGYGADATFTTSPEAPAVLTGSASALGQTSATLNGTVDPNGTEVTSCHFEYGATEAYGSSAPCSPSSPGSGSSPVAVSAPVSGLTAGTTYHLRLVATGAGGTGEGSDQSFTTPTPALPELGRCIALGERNGRYSNPSCTRVAAGEDSGRYEWRPWPLLKNGFSFGGHPHAAARFESVGGAAVKCKGEVHIEGEYTGSQSAVASVQFTECGFNGACQTEGAASGEIRTQLLAAKLGVIASGAKPSIGWNFQPASGPNLATFSCGLVSVAVTGAVISPVTPIDGMKTDFRLKFKESHGHQAPESFEGMPKEVLTLNSPLGDEQGGLQMESGNLNEEAAEIKAIS